MRVISIESIKRALADIDVLPLIEEGFIHYSAGRAVVPPVGELELPDGGVHIKYGFIREEPYYVIKIASGFPSNAQHGLPTGDGLMLLFSQRTGQPVALLSDGGHLTDVRTAAAGAVAARALAPKEVKCIGVLGTGVQARMQVEYLTRTTDCRQLVAWGRNPEACGRYRSDMISKGFRVEIASTPQEVAQRSRLLVTTTASVTPLLTAADLCPGTHINAIGSDTPAKQELAADALARADIVVADSRSQCELRGEIARASEAGALDFARVIELGDLLAGKATGRVSQDQISVFDSTGVAVQDIQIATAVAARTLD
ncbi:MAG: ornithine cyclodeaminase [Planctomycetota bacterium]